MASEQKQNGHFKIEKGVKLPERSDRAQKYPLRELQVGESFAVPLADRPKLSSAATHAQLKEPGKKFTIRKVDEQTARCWRTE